MSKVMSDEKTLAKGNDDNDSTRIVCQKCERGVLCFFQNEGDCGEHDATGADDSKLNHLRGPRTRDLHKITTSRDDLFKLLSDLQDKELV